MAVGYRVGSPQAEAAYDRWLDGQADEHMEELYGDDEDEQAHADDEGHDLEERQARARPGHIGDLG